ncbi:MAG TPA: TOPRIM nucleotidyl transferase/hydrolase domain-containing protein [Lapillicoccus sp.]|nr:TOPRIM nucleotidyl transferase/hydrolase domain-containing protein [Lapillicoccus sp.]
MVQQAVILVEGASDRRALEEVARVRGYDLTRPPVMVLAMSGITNLARHLLAVPHGMRVTGLYDVAERAYVRATLGRLGRTEPFFACDRDLEDELIRALGPDRVLDVIEEVGDRGRWEVLRHQPFHRDRPRVDVLRRFVGTTSGRKLRYAGLLASALDPGEVPAPLVAVLDEATRRISV